MKRINVMAPAKINLLLDIESIFDNGYHSMKMVMQSIDLADIVTVTRVENSDGISITSNCDDIPLDDSNIVYKAAKAFFKDTSIAEEGLEIHIDKKIPFKAGLGGGSADGAAVLFGLNVMFDCVLDKENLLKTAANVGADVPFCLVGGTALVTGIGEIVTPIKSLPECSIVVAKPSVGVDTGSAFAKYDEIEASIAHRGVHEMLHALPKGDLKRISKELFNVFEQVVKVQDVPSLKSVMLENDAMGALMTGSGSAVFGLFEYHRQASNCVKAICEMGMECHICSPVKHGVRIIIE